MQDIFRHYVKKMVKWFQKSLKCPQKSKNMHFFGQFCESKKSEKSVKNNRFFSIFRKIDLIDFFDSTASPNQYFIVKVENEFYWVLY